MIKGKEREQKSHTKYVGMFNAKVIAVNPNTEELGKILGTTIAKDPEYMGENAEGKPKVTLSIWLQDTKTAEVFNVRFNLEDSVVESKTSKYQFINDIGSTSYAETENDLPSWFVTRDYRKAKKGEEIVYKFLRAWLSNLEYNDPSTELKLDDWKKLMKGNMSEIKDVIAANTDQEICCLATIRTADDGNEYQSIYSREFLPAYSLDCFTGKKAKSYKAVDKFIAQVNDSEYGCKDYYELVPLKEYDATKNLINQTNDPVIVDTPTDTEF